MPDDTTVRPLSEDIRASADEQVRAAFATDPRVEEFRKALREVGFAASDVEEIEGFFRDTLTQMCAAVIEIVKPALDAKAATIAQRDALIEELRARVKELEDRVTSWEQDALRGSTGLAAWDWG